MTDSPTSSKNCEVEFVPCTDPDGKNYSIVKIGNQTWMAENMSYLPAVNPSSSGSKTSPYNYVYGYEGTSVASAKATANYPSFGVLYNWVASLAVCPSGWHLPSDSEWTILTDYLTNNGYGYGGSTGDIGKSMVATSGWFSSSIVGTMGNDQTSNNRSGFTAFPGGLRYYDGGFNYIEATAAFWSSSEYELLSAWYRSLDYNDIGEHRGYGDGSLGLSVRCLQNGLATVTTTEVTGITPTTASSGGNIISDGGCSIISRGVCWATGTDEPTTDYSKTIDGAGSGSFTSNLTGLNGNTR